MKQFRLFLLATSCLLACSHPSTPFLEVTVTNPLENDRTCEVIELSLQAVCDSLGTSPTHLQVLDNDGKKQLVAQCTYDGKFIFPASVTAHSSATYRIVVAADSGKAAPAAQCYGKVYKERLDDLAWENEWVAFRAYGPALQATGERGYGYDLFAKYENIDTLVVPQLYERALNPATLKNLADLRRTDSEKARRLADSISYHIDHGLGMDCYAVGATLGAGTSALIDGNHILYPWCYRTCRILNQGPIRFTALLEFSPMKVRGDTGVVETRLIELDYGTRLNRTTVSYRNLNQETPVATGIVLHEANGEVLMNKERRYIAYSDPTTGTNNGRIFIGTTFPETNIDAHVSLFTPEKRKQHSGAYGHVLAISLYRPATYYTYYWGFAWSKGSIKDMEAWSVYLDDFVQRKQTPLQIVTKMKH